MRQAAGTALLLALLALVAGCGPAPTEDGPPLPKPVLRTTQVVVAFATPSEETSVADLLARAFERSFPQFTVDIVAADNERAIASGRDKNADVLVAQGGAALAAMLAEGAGANPRAVMSDDFLLVGPTADPAKVRGAKTGAEAFERIARRGALFVSRGDDSFTAARENALWATAAIDPGDMKWYEASGKGMAETLRAAAAKKAYTLVDHATWVAGGAATPDLVVLVEEADDLAVVYSVVEVTGAHNGDGARAFSDWVTAPDGQRVIGACGAGPTGEPILTPAERP